MATNIPPHNMAETINATIALIDNPDISIDQLIDVMPGPDFPTGGIIMGVSGIRSAYKTGRGRIRVRAKAEIEKYNEDRERIVVTELPYQVNKAALVEKIAELVHEKRIDGISDLRDESDKSGMRVVIELKRNANANVVLNHLYKHTQMQDTFGVIMLALVDSEPRVLNLKQVLEYYIEHQKDVIVRRTKFELEKAQKRAHILEAVSYTHLIINRFPESDVTFSSVGENSVEISCLNSKVVLQQMDAAEFPVFPELQDEEQIKIQQNVLRAMINQTLFAAAVNEDKPILTGLLFDCLLYTSRCV